MGGSGSGRRWRHDARNTTESCQSIDIRWLKREGLLTSAIEQRITWSRNGKTLASINIRAEPGRVILSYRRRTGDGAWESTCYPVQLTTTPCHMGGVRHWFLCPARGCGERVALIYGGSIFACRKCHQLAYPSQHEDISDRAIRRANRILERLGWQGGILDGSGQEKPKGMHWRTFERLCREQTAFEWKAYEALMSRYGPGK